MARRAVNCFPDFQGFRFADGGTEVLRYWHGRVDLEIFYYSPEEIAVHRRGIGLAEKALKERRRI